MVNNATYVFNLNQHVDITMALKVSSYLILTGSLLSSLEYIRIKTHLKPSGLLSWTILRHRLPYKLSQILHPFLRYPTILILLLAHVVIAAGTMLAVYSDNDLTSFLILTVLLLHVLLGLRHPIGQEGADQMTTVVLTGLTIAYMTDDSKIQVISLTFIACQTMIAYSTAGIAKLKGKNWLAGTAVSIVLRTINFGSPNLGEKLSRYPNLGRILTWSTLVFEITFPLIVILPPVVVLSYLALGCVFHLTNAIVMGLNAFPYAFIASYPAIYILFIQNAY